VRVPDARGQLQSRSTGGIATQYTYYGLARLTRVTEPGMDITRHRVPGSPTSFSNRGRSLGRLSRRHRTARSVCDQDL